MAIKSRLYAQLEAIQYWMRRDPNMLAIWEYDTMMATTPDGRTIDIGAEFPRLATNRTPGPFGEPIDEEWIADTMVGAAAVGARAFARLPSMTTLYPIEFIMQQAGTTRSRSAVRQVGLRYTAWIEVSGRGTSCAHHNHAGLETAYANLPGLVVVVPSSTYDAKGLLNTAFAGDDPVIYINYAGLAALPPEDIPDEPFSVPFGKAAVRQEGTQLTIAYWGPATLEVVNALPQLKTAGISVEALDIRSLKPMDEETLVKSVTKTKRLLVVSFGYYTADFASHVVAVAAENVPGAKFYRQTFPDTPGRVNKGMMTWLKPDAPKIVERAKKLVG